MQGADARIQYYDDELKELNATSTANVKKAINEFFSPEKRGGLLQQVGLFVLKAVDFLSTILERLGLT